MITWYLSPVNETTLCWFQGKVTMEAPSKAVKKMDSRNLIFFLILLFCCCHQQLKHIFLSYERALEGGGKLWCCVGLGDEVAQQDRILMAFYSLRSRSGVQHWILWFVTIFFLSLFLSPYLHNSDNHLNVTIFHKTNKKTFPMTAQFTSFYYFSGPIKNLITKIHLRLSRLKDAI